MSAALCIACWSLAAIGIAALVIRDVMDNRRFLRERGTTIDLTPARHRFTDWQIQLDEIRLLPETERSARTVTAAGRTDHQEMTDGRSE